MHAVAFVLAVFIAGIEAVLLFAALALIVWGPPREPWIGRTMWLIVTIGALVVVVFLLGADVRIVQLCAAAFGVSFGSLVLRHWIDKRYPLPM